MRPLSKKQQEILAREQQILALASPMIRSGGIASLSMDAIAREMRYTRGTIYNHFPNKEDIALSLATRAVRRRQALFAYGVSFSSQPRARMAAIGIACEIYADQLPDDFYIEQVVRHDTVWPKTSDARRDMLLGCEHACITQVGQIVHEAIAAGDLTLSRNNRVEDVVFGLWSLVYGGLVLEASSPSLAESGIVNARTAIRRNCNALLDGLGWMPLYDAGKYASFVRRIEPGLRRRANEIAVEIISDKHETSAIESSETNP